MQKKWAFVAGLVVLAFFGFYLFQKFRMAPEISLAALPLQDLKGNNFDMAQLKGQRTVLCFSASWCGPCRKELKMIGKNQRAGLSDLRFVVISDESVAEIESMKLAFPYEFTWLRLTQPFSSLGIHSIPTTYLLNKAGEVVKKKVGYIDWEDPSTVNYMKGLLE